MNITSIAYGLTAPVEAVMYFLLFDTFFQRRKEFQVWQYAIGIVVLAVSINISNAYLMFTAGNVIGMIAAALIVSMYYYRTALNRRIILSVFTWALWSSIETITFNSITLLFGITASDVLGIPSYVVLGILVSKSIQFVLVYIVYIKKLSQDIELGILIWIVFLILFFSAICTSYLIFWIMNKINDSNLNIIATFCAVTLYIGIFLAFYLYVRSQRQNQIIRYQEQAEQQMRSQIKHMDEIILKQNELRALRHDMNSHLIALKSYFDQGDIVTGQKYISTLVNQFNNITQSINTGNNVLDAIISVKQSLAESKGIVFKSRICIQEKMPIAPEDLSVIFGNALDNAIEACDRLSSDEKKWITLILLQDSTSIFCKIINSSSKHDDNYLETSKVDKTNHGFGIKNIQKSLEKYHAVVLREQNEFQFAFSFVIFY